MLVSHSCLGGRRGKWTEEDYIKRAKQKINTGSADTKLRGAPQARGLREHPSRLSWRS